MLPFINFLDKKELTVYYQKLENLLNCCYGYPCGITEVFDFLFLGGENEATDKELLKRLGITHIINCASTYVCTGPRFYGNLIKK